MAGMEEHENRRHRPRWWRLTRLTGMRQRERLRQHRTADLTYRWTIGALGSLIIVIGLILVPLPGPGWLIVIMGVAVISTEFHWARRLLRFTRRHVHRWTQWIAWQPLWLRASIAVGTFCFVSAVVYLTLLLIGLPGFVPESWVPEWTGLRVSEAWG